MGAIVAQQEHCKVLGEILSQAFINDPVMTHIFPNKIRRQEQLCWIYERWLRVFTDRKGAYTTSDLSGAALWFHPEKPATIRLVEQLRAGLLPIIFRLNPLEQLRGLKAHHDVSMRMKRFMHDPHWVLETLGVAPEHHRKGVARTLLQPVLDKADASGTPCFVNTHNSINLPFYERIGFECIDASPLHGTDITVYSLRRLPQNIPCQKTISPAPAVD